ncbi:PPE-repeat protein [Goodfellowiella coeruleoviolacea]|uniref:PPE-repeat protein n=2 Tax=Goodfellowiella coeruleoviolacea TaxID=334858 RepID=A0AAE3GEY5_9PSEU|nr:PPE-repeat protein [Goodfellowiella coeruleoviolacea]
MTNQGAPYSQYGRGSGGYGPPRSNPHYQTYDGDMEANYRAEYERARQEQGFFGSLDDFIKSQRAAQQYQQDQQRQLEQQVNEYRQPAQFEGTDYMGYDHPAMKQMVTDNVDVGVTDEVGRLWNTVGNRLVSLQDVISSAVNASADGWQGEAAEAARNFMSSLGPWVGSAGASAQLMGSRVSAQQEAVERAQNAMPEPVDFDMGQALSMLMSNPNPFTLADTVSQIEQKFDEKQQAHEQAAQVMTTMSSSFQEAGSAMPAFAPPPSLDGTSSSSTSSSTSSVGTTGTGEYGVTNTGVGSTSSGNRSLGGSGVSSSGLAGVGSGVGTGTQGFSGGGGTGGGGRMGGIGNVGGGGSTGGYGDSGGAGGVGPVGPIGGGWGGGAGGGNNRGGGGFGGNNRGGGVGLPGGGRGGFGGPGGPGAGRLPGGVGGAGGVGGVGGSRLPGAGGGFGPGAAGAAGRGFGPGGAGFGPGGAGFGPGGSAAALGAQEGAGAGRGGFGPAGAGAAGARGAAGMAGAGGMGAGGRGGQGEEDKEHKAASYLIETEDIFGDGTRVAPPVIGA